MRELKFGRNMRDFLGVVAEHHEPTLSIYVVAEPSSRALPANGGLRVGHYTSPMDAVGEAYMLAERMCLKHRIHGTGFRGAKLVANVSAPLATVKDRLIETVARLLEELDGTVYTGCDMNFSGDDAHQLAIRSPYVLAGIDSPVDASAATGHGVYGSFLGAVEATRQGQLNRPRSVLVHGVGAVGGTVAARALADGFTVYTLDVVPQRAAIEGCIPVDRDRWWETPVDALLLCSGSGVVTPAMAKALRCRLVVSGANGPYAGDAETVLATKATVVPDVISNAGAVMVDSIERYHPWAWSRAEPNSVYRQVEAKLYQTTRDYLTQSGAYHYADEPIRPWGLEYDAPLERAV